MKKQNFNFINIHTNKKYEKISIANAVASRNYYDKKLECISKRYKRMKEQNAPKLILENEKRIYNETYSKFMIFDMALDFYVQALVDKRDDEDNGTNICIENLKMIQTEAQAFAREFFGSKYLKKRGEK